MTRAFLLLFLLCGLTSSSVAKQWPSELPREGECTVCARRGAGHGAESFVDWREHAGEHYGFCSEACGQAFDEMPAGYAEPVLPRPGPEFRWSALEGEVVEFTGQSALLVDFWATWCAPCIRSIPEFERLSRDFAGDGLRVVGVSIDEKLDELESFLERRPIEYAVVHDGGDDPAWWKFRVPAIPAVFLLDDRGRIVAQWSGEVDARDVRNAVEALIESE